MVKLNYLIDRMRDVKFTDYLSLFPMMMAFFLKPFYKKKYQGTWLICEEPLEARDNGYHFFKYMCENQQQQICYYAIKRKSVDAKKVEKIGKIIEYGSVQHWLAYFLCDYNISSQKGGKPNAAICAFMELNHLFHTHNVFLQHGVIINDLKWLYADRSVFDIFITSTIPEKNFIEDCFGYPDGTIKLTGLPRFDNLHQDRTNRKQIVVMPTWRYWFNLTSKKKKGLDTDFETSEYLERWKEFLESERLNDIISKYDLDVIFYPHRNMQKYISVIKNEIKTNAIIASWEEYDLQELLITSAMMITDYSSVFFDMIYMKKPVIFYQFDSEKFRYGQYSQGYFDYGDNPYGKSFRELEPLFDELSKIINNNFECNSSFLTAHKESFKYYDTNNSERVFQEIIRNRKER